MTYSIVARHPATGALGVAVQSYAPFVGAVATAALAGVGALTVQSIPDVHQKPRALAMLREGRTAEEVVAALAEGDPQADLRQTAVVDREGRAAARTGSRCLAEAGHLIGDGYAVQANLMRGPEVWPAMAQAYETHRSGNFAAALLATLDAAEAAGGDIRGRRSAAILIVPAEGEEADRTLDARVDSAVDPLGDLRLLVRMAEALDATERGDALQDPGERFLELDRAIGLVPDWDELRFWAGLSMLEIGSTDRGLTLLRGVIDADPRWRELLSRLDSSIAPAAPDALRRLAD